MAPVEGRCALEEEMDAGELPSAMDRLHAGALGHGVARKEDDAVAFA